MRVLFPSIAAVLTLSAMTLGSALAAVIYPSNNGFESPDLGSGSGAYEYGNMPGWTVSVAAGFVGEAANGSAFSVSGATNGNSDGTTSTVGQAAFLQHGDGTLAVSSITQSVGGFVAGTASIQFSAENRPFAGGFSTLTVFLDGTLIDTVVAPTGSFQDYSSGPIAVTAGSHTIGFAGNENGGDQTVFVDTVSIINTPSVPEPASLVLFGMGAAGLFAVARRRRLA
jgi:hypothetical protein